MCNVRLLFICFVLITSLCSASAQVRCGLPETECFNRRQYGGGMQTWGVMQAETGLMYYANNDGLLEYDGTFWHLYKTPSGHIVRSVMTSGERIYVGQYHRVGYFEREDNHCLEYHSIPLPDSLVLVEDIWGLQEYEGRVFAMAQQAIMEISGDSVVKVHKPIGSHFFAMYVVDGELMTCDAQRGLLIYRDGCFEELHADEVLHGEFITFAVPVTGVGVVLGTRTSGLWLMKDGEVTQWAGSANDYAVRNELFCGVKVHGEKIALGTIRGGVAIVDSKGNIETIVNKELGLVNNTVLSLGEDRDGNLWAGLDNGIARLALGEEVSLIQNAYNIGSGYAMASHKGKNYFGTNQGLFVIGDDDLRRADKRATDFKLVEGLVGQVWGLQSIDGCLFCAHDKGAFLINEQGNAVRLTPADERGVWGFCQLSDNLIVCNSYYGLMRLERKDGKWQWVGRMEGFEEGSLYLTNEGNDVLWLTYGNEAIYRLSLNVDHSKVVKCENLTNTFFSHDDKVQCERIGDDIVFTSHKGLFTYDSKRKEFVELEALTSLFEEGNMPHKIMEDDYGRIWYFCQGEVGMIKEDMASGTYRRDKRDFASLMGCFVSGHEMVFSSDSVNTFIAIEDGFAHYSPTKDNFKPSLSGKVYVRRLINIGTDSVYELFGTSEDLVVEMEYEHNTILVEYSVCAFDNAPVEYRTMLEGYDETWSGWYNSPVREFGNIQEGNYVLRIKSRDVEGIESEEIRVKIVVHPPFVRSPFMKSLYTVFGIALLVMLYWVLRRRERLVKTRQMEKEREEMEKERERMRIKAVEQEAELIKLTNKNLEADKYNNEKELTNQAYQLAKANELISNTKEMLVDMRRKQNKMTIAEMRDSISNAISEIQRGLDDVSRMQLFEVHFEKVHKEFYAMMMSKYPSLNRNDLKICAFIRMGMSSKDIASVLQITVHSVENTRSAIRQKLGLGKENMRDFMQGICGGVCPSIDEIELKK